MDKASELCIPHSLLLFTVLKGNRLLRNSCIRIAIDNKGSERPT